MKAVIDTNVLISGVFWKGPPRLVLESKLLLAVDGFRGLRILQPKAFLAEMAPK